MITLQDIHTADGVFYHAVKAYAWIERFPGLCEVQGGGYEEVLLYFKYPTGMGRVRGSRSCEIGDPAAVSDYVESKTVTANPLGDG